MTREELEATHPEYDANIDRWKFYIASYHGGHKYRDGDYLIQHPLESVENYDRRKETAYFYNYCAPIVDIQVAHLFKKAPKRDYGTFDSGDLFKSFLGDANLEGDTYEEFMRNAQTLASIYGHVHVLVDKPSVHTQTVADQIDGDIRPYLNMITPENLLDWYYERDITGRPVLSMIKVNEGVDSSGFRHYRVWGVNGWELYIVAPEDTEGDGDGVILQDAGVHGLGQIPLATIYNKQSGVRMIGLSDIADIADINKNIYYLCSDAMEITENTAFPMLAVPYESDGGGSEKAVGPRNILQFDPESPNAKPFWLEAPHSSLTEIREWITQNIEEIFRIAKLRSIRTTDSKQPRSGIALDIENQQRDSALASKADNMEAAEIRILKLYGIWEGTTFEGVIDYPDDFSIRDLDRSMDNAIKALSVSIPSITYTKEVYKDIVRGTLPKITKDVRNQIYTEVESNQKADTSGDVEVTKGDDKDD